MSIQSEINRIAGAKSDIADAIEDMGGTLSPGASIDDLAAGVRTIPQGPGGTTDANDVTYDSSETYDSGTVGAALNEQRNTLNSKADKSDLASLNLTGTTNTTESQIDAETYFYLNGALVKAKVDIANGATFTDGTNYETVTAGGLNDLSNKEERIVSSSAVHYIKMGNIVIASLNVQEVDGIHVQGGSYAYVDYIPSDLRPYNSYPVLGLAANGLGTVMGLVGVQVSDGRIFIQSSQTATFTRFNLMYII